MSRKVSKRYDMEARFEKARRRNMASASPGLHECIIVLDGLKPDFNIGKIFRSADAFGAREIHLVGVKSFDPDTAKGSVRWVPFYFHETFLDCYKCITTKGYSMVTLEPGCKDHIGSYDFAVQTAFVFGHEEFGLSFDRCEFPDITGLSIPQWGHVQSLNVSVAASIVMYEYVRQHGQPLPNGLQHVTSSVIRRVIKKRS